MALPASASHHGLAFSSDRTTQYAAAIISSTSSASGRLNRNTSVATGVSASATPASRPATGPEVRFTVAYSRATAATPSSACGASTVQVEKPKIRANSPLTHRNAGGLSTVSTLPESSDPNSQAFQLCVADWVAAA